VATGSTERPANANLALSLEHRDHHHVRNADSADQQGNGAKPEEQATETVTGDVASLDGIGRTGDGDLIGCLGTDRGSDQRPHIVQPAVDNIHINRLWFKFGLEQRLRNRRANERRSVKAWGKPHRLQHTDDLEVRIGQVDDRCRIKRSNTEPFRGNRAKDNRWDLGGPGVEKHPCGNHTVHCVQHVEIRRQHGNTTGLRCGDELRAPDRRIDN